MKKFGFIIIVLFSLGWLTKEILMPVSAALVFSSRYMELTYECDIAMEASWYYRQNNTITKESETVQLLNCHEYDKVRKILLISGLPEIYLSWLGLKSLELYQRSPEEFVEQHRFVER